MDVSAYLDRISYHGATDCTVDTFKELSAAHLKTVPFENLNFSHGHRSLEIREVFHRIVIQRRGGVCFELNGLFAWLLNQLGFEAELLRGNTVHDHELFVRDDHPLVRVRMKNGEEWLGDVGNNGFLFIEPLKFELGVPQDLANGKYIVCREDDLFVLKRLRRQQLVEEERRSRCGIGESVWRTMYRFQGEGEKLSNFDEALQIQRNCPTNFHNRNSMCSLISREGMTLLWGHTLIRKEYIDTITERIVEKKTIYDEEKLSEILRSNFGIVINSKVEFCALDSDRLKA